MTLTTCGAQLAAPCRLRHKVCKAGAARALRRAEAWNVESFGLVSRWVETVDESETQTCFLMFYIVVQLKDTTVKLDENVDGLCNLCFKKGLSAKRVRVAGIVSVVQCIFETSIRYITTCSCIWFVAGPRLHSWLSPILRVNETAKHVLKNNSNRTSQLYKLSCCPTKNGVCFSWTALLV